MRFTKIKYGSDKKHYFEYEVVKDAENDAIDEFKFSSKDKALPGFYEKLQALAVYVCDICEFPLDWAKDITVLGVSFSYAGEDDVMGAVITATRQLMHSNSPLVVNTPHKPSEFYSKGENDMRDMNELLPRACVGMLEDLQAEAEKYVNGERENQQMGMFDENAKQPSANGDGTPTDKSQTGMSVPPKQGKPLGKGKQGIHKAVKDFQKTMVDMVNDPKSGIDSISISSPSMPGNVVEFKSQ